jgi:L-threonylcarbamoyladenylate synthase
MDRIHRAVEDVDPISECIGASLWPGPLTIILPKNPAIPKGVTGGLDTVGIRIPDDPLAQELLRYADVPVAAPSANRSGRPSPTAFWMVQRDLAGRIDGIIQGPDTRIGLESTIIQVQSGKVVILRPGVIGVSQIQEVLGVQGMDHIQVQYANEQSFAVPGTRYRHYSPSMEVQAFEDLASLQAKLKAAQKINPDVRYAVLTTQRFAAMPDLVCTNRVIVYADLEQYAH